MQEDSNLSVLHPHHWRETGTKLIEHRETEIKPIIRGKRDIRMHRSFNVTSLERKPCPVENYKRRSHFRSGKIDTGLHHLFHDEALGWRQKIHNEEETTKKNQWDHAKTKTIEKLCRSERPKRASEDPEPMRSPKNEDSSKCSDPNDLSKRASKISWWSTYTHNPFKELLFLHSPFFKHQSTIPAIQIEEFRDPRQY